jgi:phytol kinase
MWLGPFFSSPLGQDLVALLSSFAIVTLWLQANDLLARRRWLPRVLTRKLVHIGTGPIFLLAWSLFSDAWHARWLAALVPAAVLVLFLLVVSGRLQSQDLVSSMTRTGDPRELLRGPFAYGLVFIACTLVFWKYSPVGVICLMLLCGGDGFADVFGRLYGRVRLPWQPHKTWAGSVAFFLAGFAFSLGYLALFSGWGYFRLDLAQALGPLALLCLVGTLIEAYSATDVDNLTVPAGVAAVAWLFTDVLSWWHVSFL